MHAQSVTVSRSEEPTPVGRVGRLVLATRGTDGPGEVRIPIRGGTELFTAWSVQALPADANVLVVGHRSSRVLDVEPWDETLVAAPPSAH